MKFRNKITNAILPGNPKAKFPASKCGSTNFEGTSQSEYQAQVNMHFKGENLRARYIVKTAHAQL